MKEKRWYRPIDRQADEIIFIGCTNDLIQSYGFIFLLFWFHGEMDIATVFFRSIGSGEIYLVIYYRMTNKCTSQAKLYVSKWIDLHHFVSFSTPLPTMIAVYIPSCNTLFPPFCITLRYTHVHFDFYWVPARISRLCRAVRNGFRHFACLEGLFLRECMHLFLNPPEISFS